MKIQRAIAPASTGAAETLKNKAVVADKTVATTAETNASAPNESYTPDAEGESRASAAFRGGVRKGVAWGKAAEKPIGGLSILAGVAIGGTALAFGGAVVGGIIGGGVGPVVASITTEGAWNFLTSSFSNVGTAIQVGSTVGAVAGLVGGAIIGKNVGDTVAHGAAFVPGFVVGYGQGFANPDSIPAPVQGEKEEPKHRSELRGAFRTQAKVLSGFGALSGAVGGFVGGAAVTAAGSLVVDVAAGDFTFKNFASQLSTPAVIGGLIGGASLAVVGGFGGEGVAKATQWTFDKTIGKATAGQPGLRERIEKKEGELEVRQTGLQSKAQDLAQDTESFRANHKATSEALNQREDRVAGDEQRVAQDLSTINTRIENTATAGYEERSAKPDASLDAKGNHAIIGERTSLDAWDSKLNGWQGDLNGFRGELQTWESKLDGKIDKDAAAIFGEERKPIDEHFGGLQKELDAFEKKMDSYEADIKSRIDSKYRSGISAEKPGVDSDLSSARSEKQSSERDKSDARSQRDSAASRNDSAERSLSSAKSRLRSAESEGNSLQSRVSQLHGRISSLQSQLNSCRVS